MKKNEYAILFSVNGEIFGSMIIKARNEHDAYGKAIRILIKNNIALHANVDFDIEQI